MLRKIVNIFAVIVLLPVFVSAQEHTILKPDGTIYKKYGDLKKAEVIKVTKGKTVIYEKQNTINGFSQTPLSLDGVIDTLHYDPPWDINFGYFGQDWMLQWFVCPADLVLKFAGFAANENADVMPVELKIVRVNWTAEDLANAGIAQHGWYEAVGNGFNDITAFLDNPDNTGGWVSQDGGLPEPFGNDIWSDGGVGFTIVPVGGARTDYQWVDMNIWEEPEFLQGEIFGIAIKHAGPDMDSNRIGYWASGINPQWAWKFYANGRTSGDLSTAGWWSREFHWNFRAIVNLTGDRAPIINSFTTITSGPDTGPFTVDANITDDNPGDPANAGVDNVTLWWTNCGTDWNDIAMAGTEPDYTGEIPAQVPCTTLEYYIEATDIMGLTSESVHRFRFTFCSSNAPTLVLYNRLISVNGYPQDYYWGSNIASGNSTFNHDRWAYGELPLSVADNYTNIIEICAGGTVDINNNAIRTWLESDSSRNYFLAGQDWLRSPWDLDYLPGDFEYDILGLVHPYFDVSYYTGGDQYLPSKLIAEDSTLFGEPLLNLFNSINPPADSIMYNPNLIQGYPNWIDAIEVLSDVTVDMNVETRSLDGVPAVEIKPTIVHRTLPAGNKIVFMAFDPLSITTAVDSSYPYYYWMGFDSSNVVFQTLKWFGIDIITDVRESSGVIPAEFSLSQNYPNPFNPSTIISWQSPIGSWQTLKVYDILGNEVASLVDEYKPAGNYEVEFNPGSGIRNLASGIYFYQLRVGDPSTGSGQGFIQTKKMVFLK